MKIQEGGTAPYPRCRRPWLELEYRLGLELSDYIRFQSNVFSGKYTRSKKGGGLFWALGDYEERTRELVTHIFEK